MPFNKKRLAQHQERKQFALEILDAIDALCSSTLRAAKRKQLDEFNAGASRLHKIGRRLGRHGDELTAASKGVDLENLLIHSTQEERAEEAKDVLRRVKYLCSSVTLLVSAGQTEEAQGLAPYIKEIMAACSSVSD